MNKALVMFLHLIGTTGFLIGRQNQSVPVSLACLASQAKKLTHNDIDLCDDPFGYAQEDSSARLTPKTDLNDPFGCDTLSAYNHHETAAFDTTEPEENCEDDDCMPLEDQKIINGNLDQINKKLVTIFIYAAGTDNQRVTSALEPALTKITPELIRRFALLTDTLDESSVIKSIGAMLCVGQALPLISNNCTRLLASCDNELQKFRLKYKQTGYFWSESDLLTAARGEDLKKIQKLLRNKHALEKLRWRVRLFMCANKATAILGVQKQQEFGVDRQQIKVQLKDISSKLSVIFMEVSGVDNARFAQLTGPLLTKIAPELIRKFAMLTDTLDEAAVMRTIAQMLVMEQALPLINENCARLLAHYNNELQKFRVKYNQTACFWSDNDLQKAAKEDDLAEINNLLRNKRALTKFRWRIRLFVYANKTADILHAMQQHKGACIAGGTALTLALWSIRLLTK